MIGKKFLTILLLSLTALVQAQEPADPSQIDRLGQALDIVGFTRADLGYQPKGYWNRFPQPKQIPHILPFFEDLYAEPLKVYDYTKTMGNTIAFYMNPDYFDTAGNSLHRIVYILGVDRKITGFRNYSVNLDPQPDSAQPIWAQMRPMLEAFRLIERAESHQQNYISFGSQYGGPDDEDLKSQLSALPIDLQIIVASLMLNIYDAYKWRQLAVRNLRQEDMAALFEFKDLDKTLGDGQVYYPEIDDIAAGLDEHSLYYACLKAAQAAETCHNELRQYVGATRDDLSKIAFEYSCPLGRVVIRGAGNDETFCRDAAILIDLGGNDRHQGNLGAASSLAVPISVAIDLSGDDTYANDDPDLLSQGAAILGAGILIDGGGKDKYTAVKMAQGCGLFGLGLLLDIAGDDDYKLETSGQGCGYLGLGFLLDIKGNDTRYLYADGQGFGGVGGIGVIADYEGDDKYTAEPLAEIADRGDYHSEDKINVNAAQGAGMGRRGDGSDGHSWAGGLGALIDIKGDDEYYSGNWTLGCGYWFGTGVVYEGNGDDLYKSVYFTQASGAHYCIGAILDEGGNDRHELWETAGAGIAFGWDYTVALLFDIGGNDRYEAKIISLGCAQIRSDAMLIDIGGDDYYQLQHDQQGFGAATYRESYDNPNEFSPYDIYAKSFALLLDIGGKDTYKDWYPENDKTFASKKCADNTAWLSPSIDDEHYGANNFGVGLDVDKGRVPELEAFRK